MDLESRFFQIKSFLIEHQDLLQTEVLESFERLPEKYHEWAKELKNLSQLEIIDLENNLISKKIYNEGHLDFLNTIKSLSKVEHLNSTKFAIEEIPPNLKRKLTLKKQHEISHISSYLSNKSYKTILDIGSGAGHLSAILLSYDKKKKSICVDMSKEVQAIGIKKLERENPEILRRLSFIERKIDDQTSLQDINYDLLLGLHTCGDLSVNLLKIHLKNKIENKKGSFLNFGCCYHKLSTDSLNLSQRAREKPVLHLSHHALTMAAKSYKSLSPKEYDERVAVKNFRYGIHLFMKRKLDLDFQTLGNATASDYKGSFSDYAKKYCSQTHNTNAQVLEDFYQKNLLLIKDVQYLGIIRSHLSRLAELYIVLDRVLFIKETNPNLEFGELFDRKISPRNFGIYVY